MKSFSVFFFYIGFVVSQVIGRPNDDAQFLRQLAPPCRGPGVSCNSKKVCCSGVSDCISGLCKDDQNPPGPTTPPPPVTFNADGLCTCASCTDNLHLNQLCSSDVDCSGECTGGDLAGFACSTDIQCPPNSGKPANRGSCNKDNVINGYCQETTCPRPDIGNTPVTTPVTYTPGDYSDGTILYDKYGNGIQVSNGLNGRAIAYVNEPVQFFNDDGTCSTTGGTFHGLPDGAGVFPASKYGNLSDTGFYYSSNSELSGNGGVGSLKLTEKGDVSDYARTLTGTWRNCGGGIMSWGSWVSCEESSSGTGCWQTDPSGTKPAVLTEIVDGGESYESTVEVANMDGIYPIFITTCDTTYGAVTRYTPDQVGKVCFDQNEWCTLNNGNRDYLMLSDTSCPSTGSFSWTSNKADAGNNAAAGFPGSEGIDVVGKKVYMTSKQKARLHILDLDTMMFECSSTRSGAFNNQPDQIEMITNDPTGIVYFCEDGGSDCGVHGRDMIGKFFSIIDAPGYNTETTGLAFDPTNHVMIVAFQGSPGVIWQFWRNDGHAFNQTTLDIKYH